MAESITIKSGSLFTDNPVVFGVMASTVGMDAVFHRVFLEVTAESGAFRSTVLFNSPALDGETIHFDISGALRSVANQYTYEPTNNTTSYSSVSYTLRAYDEYLRDGIHSGKVDEVTYGGAMYAIRGGFTRLERLDVGDTMAVQHFSRKPTKGEVCGLGETFLSPRPYAAPISLGQQPDAPTTDRSILSTAGAVTVDGRSIYVVEDVRERYLLQFINQRGVAETVSVVSLASVSYQTAKDSFQRSANQTFSTKANTYTRHTDPTKVFSLSTGVIDSEWAEWFATDLFQADRGVWLKQGDKWLPVTLDAGSEIAVIDKTNNAMLHIPFTATVIV